MSQESLKKIRQAARLWQRGGLAPKTSLITVYVAGIIILSLAVYEAFSVKSVSMTFILAAFVGTVVGFKSDAPKTHEQYIDSLLSAYEPKDKESFKWLQDETRKVGKLDVEVVLEWLKKETAAVRGEKKPDAKEIQFLSKKV